MAEVISLMDNRPIATCQCGNGLWMLLVDGFGEEWSKIVGMKCAECGEEIAWITAESAIVQSDN